jgi:hypothetical protein
MTFTNRLTRLPHVSHSVRLQSTLLPGTTRGPDYNPGPLKVPCDVCEIGRRYF